MKAAGSRTIRFPARDYDLGATLDSGQAFRWTLQDGAWTGVLKGRWVSLRQEGSVIHATTAESVTDWTWLRDYLQLDVDLASVLASFPQDQPMGRAVVRCRGLRLLAQEPWECLASFILSSSKQIVQIRQVVAALCERFGAGLPVPAGMPQAFAFPGPERLARATQTELRACKMGYRAPYLLGTARAIAAGFDLEKLRTQPLHEARRELLTLPGVGRKVADCVLLFAFGFQPAFPVDVWVMRALRELYFPRRRVPLKKLHRFAATHFGPYAGYAQQYLFHYMRLQNARLSAPRAQRAQPEKNGGE